MRQLPTTLPTREQDRLPAIAAPASPPPATVIGADWPGRELQGDPRLARILLAVWRSDPAVCVPACPGAGKSRLVTMLSAALADCAGLRIAVAAQTREQALASIRGLT